MCGVPLYLVLVFDFMRCLILVATAYTSPVSCAHFCLYAICVLCPFVSDDTVSETNGGKNEGGLNGTSEDDSSSDSAVEGEEDDVSSSDSDGSDEAAAAPAPRRANQKYSYFVPS
jgi:hypothetical protein